MKIGLRTPSLKKSIMGMTTSQVKRGMMRSIDPTYGKKGIGFIKDTNKAVYNQIYSKTTFGGISGLKNNNIYIPQADENIFTELNNTDGLFCAFIKLLYFLKIIK